MGLPIVTSMTVREKMQELRMNADVAARVNYGNKDEVANAARALLTDCLKRLLALNKALDPTDAG